jgi:serine phosphatase RsbU (regulator of sigma subunit)
LLRIAGDGELPERLTAEGAVGPEFDAEGVAALCEVLRARWPRGAVEPLWVLGRAMGVLIASEPAGKELAELAGAAAPMFELATGFTDVFERGRRREQPSAAAEMQLELLPPRMAHVARGRIVASVLPAYDVGGDWFDHADNPEGVWFAIADAMGKGTRAAAMSAVSIGAFRSARRQGETVQGCCLQMHHAIEALGMDAFVTAIIALWDPRGATFTWTNCGHLNPLLARDGNVRELVGETTYPLGIIEHERVFSTSAARLLPGDRLLMYSDGIVEARLRDGTRFGVERLKTLLTRTARDAPSLAVAAIERDVVAATAGDVRDDATQLLFAVD